MRILYVAPFLNSPPDNGASIRAYNLIMGLCSHHRVSVITFGSRRDEALMQWAKEYLENLCLLPPIKKRDFPVGFKGVIHRLLQSPWEAFSRIGKPIAQAVEAALAEVQKPDVVVIDTLMAAQDVVVAMSPVPMVLSLYDVASHYHWRQFRRLGIQAFKVVTFVDWFKTKRYERNIVRRFQHITTVSKPNCEAIQKVHTGAKVYVVPNGVDTHNFPVIEDGLGDSILFVANFEYAPNVEALWFFYDEIWSIIRNRINAVFLVVGRHPPTEFVERTRFDQTVRIASDVADVRPYYVQARISVVPLLTGEGTRLKILESFSLGVPVVTTSVGCEGLDFGVSTPCVIADSPDDFANSVFQLYSDHVRIAKLRREGRELVERQYDWQIIGKHLRECLEQIERVDLSSH